MSLLRYHRPISSLVPSLFNIYFDKFDGNTEIIPVNENTQGKYVAIDENNITTTQYYINDVGVSLPFTVYDGDELRIEITRTNQNLTSTLKLFKIASTTLDQENPLLSFVLRGEVYNDTNSNYDTNIILYEYEYDNSTTYTTADETNIGSYTVEIDTGSGFSSDTLPFTLNTGDLLRIAINRTDVDAYSKINFYNSSSTFREEINKSVYGYTPYCTQQFNGSSQYCTITNSSALQMSLGVEENVTGWVYPTSNTTQCILTNVDGVDDTGWYVKLKAGSTSPTLQFQLWDDAGNSLDYNTVSELPLNQWTFFHIKKDSSNVVSIDLGDKDTATLSTSVSLTDNSTGSISGTTEHTADSIIGKDFDATNYFSGHLDNLMKSFRELTSKEIEVLFNNGWAGFPMSLDTTDIDFYYKITRDAFSYYTDFSSNENHPTLVNFTGNLDRYYRETMTAV